MFSGLVDLYPHTRPNRPNPSDTYTYTLQVLIYVFDVESAETEKDMSHFMGVLEVRLRSFAFIQPNRASQSIGQPTLITTISPPQPQIKITQAIDQYSPDAKLFVLIHKMDLVPEEDREAVFEERRHLIEAQAATRFSFQFTFFKTSIWDETLYKAWSSIVYQLIPNVKSLEHQLESLCEICGADEMVLFEKATFLVISHATHRAHADVHRFEKISNIIKQFKLRYFT